MPLVDSLQTNKQHPVPQNIMDVEFKLIGDLTMRQFAYLIAFGFVSYLFIVGLPGLFKWPAAVLTALLGLGLAFVPVNERGLDEWIFNFIKSMYAPSQMIWKKQPTLPSAFAYDSVAVVRQELITLAPTSSRRKLEEYLKHQEDTSVKDPLDIPERDYILRIRDYYSQREASGADMTVPAGVLSGGFQAPDGSPVVAMASSAARGQLPQNTPTGQAFAPSSTPEESMKQDMRASGAPAQLGSAQAGLGANGVAQAGAEQPASAPTGLSQSSSLQPPASPQASQRPSASSQAPQQPSAQSQPPRQPNAGTGRDRPHYQQLAEAETPRQKLDLPKIVSDRGITLTTMTPDMHSGRRFTNLVPGQGELVLPIRRERVLTLGDESEAVEEDIKTRALKLQELIAQIKESEAGKLPLKKARPAENVGQGVPSGAFGASGVSGASGRATGLSQGALSSGGATAATGANANTGLNGGANVNISPLSASQNAIPTAPMAPEIALQQDAQELVRQIQSKNDKLAAEIRRLRGELDKPLQPNAPVPSETINEITKLEVEKNRLSSEYDALKRQLADLQAKLVTKPAGTLDSAPSTQPRTFPQADVSSQAPAQTPINYKELTQTQRMATENTGASPNLVRIPQLATRPNMLGGIVKDIMGKGVPNILLIIKTNKGEPVRAFKTNAIGQFSLATPLANGVYTLEVSSDTSKGQTFDIISFEAKGELIPPFELLEK